MLYELANWRFLNTVYLQKHRHGDAMPMESSALGALCCGSTRRSQHGVYVPLRLRRRPERVRTGSVTRIPLMQPLGIARYLVVRIDTPAEEQ